MKFCKCDPQLIVVNVKLYAFGGLGFKPKGSSGLMEAFASYIVPKNIIHALSDTETKQEIIVAKPLRWGYAQFYRFNVMRSS